MAQAVCVIIGVFFLGMGVYALAAPAALIRPFGIRLTEPSARYEVRAVYGGFGLAMAAVLAVAAVDLAALRGGIMVAVGAALAGMAMGRVVSAVLDERTAFYPTWFYAAVETIGAAALFLAA
ncbi:DUF4345 family protein [Nocardia implantans]|uniref:DUF4345 family protein n=1 Tax=Nocardia implantans TaxID=3108168 RepID=A0ABU6AYQ8_9NOCA|nr:MULTISPECIES: DUF4345 family protein [unclassified Nocardia]MBF6194286.1 DUF4345 family protein [Nocardia beijingensis]MEA3529894.1 DUF4345 family protein [Nocardia sp. CDC192]MEB3512628.1 DUF4345 family protein [Nocardia sp. CDC186]